MAVEPLWPAPLRRQCLPVDAGVLCARTAAASS